MAEPETPPAPPVKEREPEQRKTLEDALRIAYDIHNATLGTLATPSADDLVTLGQGFIILAQDLAGYWDAISKQKNFCGWCEKSGISRADLPSMTIDDIRAHTVGCEHNPLVQELQRLRPVFVAAEAWREAVKARDENRASKELVVAAQVARDELERMIDRAIDSEPSDNPAEWPDAGAEPLKCCPRFTWGDGTHDLSCPTLKTEQPR